MNKGEIEVTFLYELEGKQPPKGSTVEQRVKARLRTLPRLRFVSRKNTPQGFSVTLRGHDTWPVQVGLLDDSLLTIGKLLGELFATENRRPIFIGASTTGELYGPEVLVSWQGDYYTVRSSLTEPPQVVLASSAAISQTSVESSSS